MKRVLILITCLWLATNCFAQQTTWKEFTAFHETVSKVLHPIMNGNIQPVKDNSSLLLTKAKQWQASAVPAGIDAGTFKTDIAGLVTECKALDDAVKAKENDTELKTKAIQVHESFHALLSACHIKD